MITALLDLNIKPEELANYRAILDDVLVATRGFDGCLGVEVLVDIDDPAHVVVIERWESLAHDDAYRAFRAAEPSSALAPLIAKAPGLVRLTD
jgi:heme oxygenase (mycobilin-producing)